jgi:hypothetical protein
MYYSAVLTMAQYSTVRYNTVQCSEVEHIAEQFGTSPYSAV